MGRAFRIHGKSETRPTIEKIEFEPKAGSSIKSIPAETNCLPPPLTQRRNVFRKLPSQETTENWESPADRRSAQAVVRLCAGIFLLYQRATKAKESDPFIRDAQSWAAFEQAALPQMASFTFYDKANQATRTPNSVLADAMGHVWLVNSLKRPTTIQLITGLANHICAAYEITPIDRRTRKRASLGLNVVG